MKKFPRAPMRPEKEPEVEIEIWQPGWKCYCCHDSGIVAPNLAGLVIDGYNDNRDQIPLCVNPGCKASSKYDSEFLDSSVDRRIDPATCQELDSLERENWRRTLFVHGRRAKQATQDLAKEKSLRRRDRTPDETAQAQEQHRLVVEEENDQISTDLAKSH